jgi:hypothetical protein
MNPTEAVPTQRLHEWWSVCHRLNFFQLSCEHRTDVSMCEAETDSPILAEPIKSQDLLSHSPGRAVHCSFLP